MKDERRGIFCSACLRLSAVDQDEGRGAGGKLPSKKAAVGWATAFRNTKAPGAGLVRLPELERAAIRPSGIAA